MNKALKIFLSTSTGLVILLVWMFAYLKTDSIFLNDTAAWNLYITRWVILFGFTISITGALAGKYIKSVFQFPFWKEAGKFILFSIISFIAFYGLIYLVKGSIAPIYIVAAPILFIYAFFVAYPEETIFRGIIQNVLKDQKMSKFAYYTISTLIFAMFHWALGRSALTLIIYIPLGYLLSWVKDKYSPVSNFANTGVHFAYDVVLLLFGAT